ncbi:hypothetical protein OIU77_009741 [Salix suchowensis]|uniref:H15 domain-containing protein n=1 Tax=Salix suchowensis TaxID=1278906 RepID=A0ABQ9A5Z5_9ROSI|nr:hypothetical protein OIU77_009741 [Salix suchowensis]
MGKSLDNLILEAITTLKEPSGSDRASIALYIQEKYWAPMNLRKLLGGKLKHLTANGKLIKVKHKYRIASSSTVSEGRRNHPLPEGKQKDMLKLERSKNKILTKAQVDQDLLKIRGMTALEAAAAAAKAVAEAETAIAEAEAAAREAEKAEAEAEAAQVFAKAAIKAFKHRACHPWFCIKNMVAELWGNESLLRMIKVVPLQVETHTIEAVQFLPSTPTNHHPLLDIIPML